MEELSCENPASDEDNNKNLLKSSKDISDSSSDVACVQTPVRSPKNRSHSAPATPRNRRTSVVPETPVIVLPPKRSLSPEKEAHKKEKKDDESVDNKNVISDSECPPLSNNLFKAPVKTNSMLSVNSSASSSDKAPSKKASTKVEKIIWGSVSRDMVSKTSSSTTMTVSNSNSPKAANPKGKAKAKAKSKKESKVKEEEEKRKQAEQKKVTTPKKANNTTPPTVTATPKKTAKSKATPATTPSKSEKQDSVSTKQESDEESSSSSESDSDSSSDESSVFDWRQRAAQRNQAAAAISAAQEAAADAEAAMTALTLEAETPESIAAATIPAHKNFRVFNDKENTPKNKTDSLIQANDHLDSSASTCSTAHPVKSKYNLHFHHFTTIAENTSMNMDTTQHRRVGMEIEQFEQCVTKFETNEVRPEAVQFVQDMCDYVFDTDKFFRRLFCEATSFWCPDADKVRPFVKAYGSYASNLFLPQSDVDCVLGATVDDGATAKPLMRNDELIKTLSQHFDITWQEGRENLEEDERHKELMVRLKEWVEGEPFLVPAKVAIVQLNTTKLFDRHLTQIDLSILHPEHLGDTAVEMLKKYQEEFPTLRPLVLVLKQMLYTRGLNVARHFGLPSYGLVLMVVSFLQTKALHDKYYNTFNKHEELGVQFMRLCQFYSGYCDGNSPAVPIAHSNGVSYKQEDLVQVFDWACMGLCPSPPGQATDTALMWTAAPHQYGEMTILDPAQQENNVARVTCRAQELMMTFRHAWSILADSCTCCQAPGGFEKTDKCRKILSRMFLH